MVEYIEREEAERLVANTAAETTGVRRNRPVKVAVEKRNVGEREREREETEDGAKFFPFFISLAPTQ